jgi:3-hydroxyacyl-CoA dehydrogenase
VDASEALRAQLGEARMEPPGRLVQMQREGRLGRKTGCGFFDY